jgi:hypothetical protein
LGECFNALTHLVAVGRDTALLAVLQQHLSAMGIQLTQISTEGKYLLPTSPDDEYIKNLLKEIAEVDGPVDGFICLACDDEPERDARAESILFLFAKHMQRVIRPSQHGGRQCFIACTSLDGNLGVGGEVKLHARNGSVFGLLKSLQQEWPQFFCRAIDFAPALSTEQRIISLLAELQDPQKGLVEVGIDQAGRWTIQWQEEMT